MGYIPKTTKQKVKVFMGLSALRLVVGVISVFFAEMILAKISDSVAVQLLGSGITLVIYLILSGRSPSNPNKIFALSMLDFFSYFVTPKKIYGPRTEEFARYKEREEIKNAKKEQGKARKGKQSEQQEEE